MGGEQSTERHSDALVVDNRSDSEAVAQPQSLETNGDAPQSFETEVPSSEVDDRPAEQNAERVSKTVNVEESDTDSGEATLKELAKTLVNEIIESLPSGGQGDDEIAEGKGKEASSHTESSEAQETNSADVIVAEVIEVQTKKLDDNQAVDVADSSESHQQNDGMNSSDSILAPVEEENPSSPQEEGVISQANQEHKGNSSATTGTEIMLQQQVQNGRLPEDAVPAAEPHIQSDQLRPNKEANLTLAQEEKAPAAEGEEKRSDSLEDVQAGGPGGSTDELSANLVGESEMHGVGDEERIGSPPDDTLLIAPHQTAGEAEVHDQTIVGGKDDGQGSQDRPDVDTSASSQNVLNDEKNVNEESSSLHANDVGANVSSAQVMEEEQTVKLQNDDEGTSAEDTPVSCHGDGIQPSPIVEDESRKTSVAEDASTAPPATVTKGGEAGPDEEENEPLLGTPEVTEEAEPSPVHGVKSEEGLVVEETSLAQTIPENDHGGAEILPPNDEDESGKTLVTEDALTAPPAPQTKSGQSGPDQEENEPLLQTAEVTEEAESSPVHEVKSEDQLVVEQTSTAQTIPENLDGEAENLPPNVEDESGKTSVAEDALTAPPAPVKKSGQSGPDKEENEPLQETAEVMEEAEPSPAHEVKSAEAVVVEEPSMAQTIPENDHHAVEHLPPNDGGDVPQEEEGVFASETVMNIMNRDGNLSSAEEDETLSNTDMASDSSDSLVYSSSVSSRTDGMRSPHSEIADAREENEAAGALASQQTDSQTRRKQLQSSLGPHWVLPSLDTVPEAECSDIAHPAEPVELEAEPGATAKKLPTDEKLSAVRNVSESGSVAEPPAKIEAVAERVVVDGKSELAGTKASVPAPGVSDQLQFPPAENGEPTVGGSGQERALSSAASEMDQDAVETTKGESAEREGQVPKGEDLRTADEPSTSQGVRADEEEQKLPKVELNDKTAAGTTDKVTVDGGVTATAEDLQIVNDTEMHEGHTKEDAFRAKSRTISSPPNVENDVAAEAADDTDEMAEMELESRKDVRVRRARIIQQGVDSGRNNLPVRDVILDNLPRIQEKDLIQLVNRACDGGVTRAKFINATRAKVTLELEDDVQRVIKMYDRFEWRGRALTVHKYGEAPDDNEEVEQPDTEAPEDPKRNENRRLLFENLPPDLEEKGLKQLIMSSLSGGNRMFINLVRDPTGKHYNAGYATVTFPSPEALEEAFAALQTLSCEGRNVSVRIMDVDQEKKAKRKVEPKEPTRPTDYSGHIIEIGHLPRWYTTADLQELTSTFVKDKQDALATILETPEGISRGHGIVYFKFSRDAENAKKELSDRRIGRGKIRVRDAEEAHEPWGTYISIYNLSDRASVGDLVKFFGRFGKVAGALILYDKYGVHQERGTIKFAQAEDGIAAARRYQNELLMGKRLRLEIDEAGPVKYQLMGNIMRKFEGESYEGRVVQINNLALPYGQHVLLDQLIEQHSRGAFRATQLFAPDRTSLNKAIVTFADKQDARAFATEVEGLMVAGAQIHITWPIVPQWGTYIQVAGFPPSVDRRELQSLFEQYGEVDGCEVFYKRNQGIVKFIRSMDGKVAVENLNGSTFKGAKLEVDFDWLAPSSYLLAHKIRTVIHMNLDGGQSQHASNSDSHLITMDGKETFNDYIVALNDLGDNAPHHRDVERAIVLQISGISTDFRMVTFSAKQKNPACALIVFREKADVQKVLNYFNGGGAILGCGHLAVNNPKAPQSEEPHARYLRITDNGNLQDDEVVKLFESIGEVNGARRIGLRPPSLIISMKEGNDGIEAVKQLNGYTLRGVKLGVQVDHYGPVSWEIARRSQTKKNRRR
ncbi:hypothetical protein HK104_009404 [Borealophlyctis nickersoniae]|nr:hypothetical protein HK104_009404 [Borealophlyctis nickersoniae]